ncbi:hypothetical protein R5R35_009827 [Gryllus longicercus]|uniref:Ketoreductase domain-containing protein n=1 Tax=Gryllus longicercus TaxID=2509291 RepID=A0AAN9VQR5_9ORTH
MSSAQYASLKEKVVLITGASSGIGAGTARVFAKNGARLALCGRQENNLKKVSEECTALGAREVKSLLGDLTDLNCCKKIICDVIEHYGQLDVLVNSAGRLLNNTIENVTPEQYDDIMNVNTRSIVFLTQYAVPHLTKTKGTIVNVSSVVGIRSFPGILAYCMSKSAVDQFTKCVALELASKGIRVNAVNPGVIKTEVHKRGGMSEAEYKKFLERGKETHALGRVGEPEEVGNAIAFLASSESSFITGETLPVDGGRHVMCPR